MSLWGIFVFVGTVGIIVSIAAAILRPRDSRDQTSARALTGPEVEKRDSLVGLQARVDALEVEVDDLQRAVSALREENEYLQQRIDGSSSTGEYP